MPAWGWVLVCWVAVSLMLAVPMGRMMAAPHRDQRPRRSL